ncbi:class I SAM-dependent methyltransferase [Myroides sp. LJL116]
MNKLDDKKFLDVEDYSISKEKFSIYLDKELNILKTIPQPKVEEMHRYYQSENYISHSDNSRGLFNRIYQVVKKNAIQRKLQFIQSLRPQAKSILDIGCGTGEFLLHAKNNGWKTTGLEPSDQAKNLAKQKGLELVEHSSELKDASFDVITMWHVLEHVADLDFQIKELRRLLKKDGIILIAVPNHESYDAQYYKQFWAAYDVPRHLWHFSRSSIINLFEKYHFSIQGLYPLVFDSFYVSLLSEEYKTGKKNWWKAFCIGLKSNVKAKQTLNYSSITYIFEKLEKGD